MGTHALALGLTYTAYVLIRKFSGSALFPKGTDKIGVLAGYTSSIFLGLTGVWIIFEAVSRIINPVQIHFNEEISVAVVGLIVNLICIFIMEGNEKHDSSECKHCAECHSHDEDYNFKSAYYHILADALTSFLAISALLVGKYFGFIYLDPLSGILGGILIFKWAVELIKKTVVVLVDMGENRE
jgi:cation diffusion facilitator family transporter